MQVIHPAEGIRVFADAGLILFWQVDYCSNNIRLVLLMQTASTHCSLACERACAVRSVLEPLNSGGYWVQRGHPPVFSPPRTSFLSSQQLLWLPSSLAFREEAINYSRCTFLFCLNCKNMNLSCENIPACALQKKYTSFESGVGFVPLLQQQKAEYVIFIQLAYRTAWSTWFPRMLLSDWKPPPSPPCGCCGECTGPGW